LLLCGVAAYQVFVQHSGLTPQVMAGHSLGELTALVCAGVIGFEDGIRLARGRGEAMSRCTQSAETGMAAVTQLGYEQVEKLCRQHLGFGERFVIANYNSPQQLVLSGEREALQQVGETLTAAGAFFIPLRVSGAFHSPMMRPAAQEFRALIAAVPLNEPKIPVLANINARPYLKAATVAESLIQQVVSPVRWQESLLYLQNEYDQGPMDLFIDAGPGNVVKKLCQSVLPKAQSYALDLAADVAPLMQQLETDIRTLREHPPLLGKCLAVAVSTRNTNWDNDSYQQNVVLPYQQLKTLHETLREKGIEPSAEQMKQAMELLRNIMRAKGASEQEQRQRFRDIVRTTGTEEVLQQYAF
jgi:[acyl-carrier-protein] S-malonyltransferase